MTKPSKVKQPKVLTEGDVAHLVGTLELQKQLGGEAYPPTLGWLLNLAGMPESLAGALTKSQTVRTRIALTAKTNVTADQAKSAFVVLLEDLETMASSPALLVHCLRRATASNSELFTLVELASRLPSSVEKPFKQAWKTLIEQKRLPAEVGTLRRGRYPMLFLLERVPAFAQVLAREAGVTSATSVTEHVLAAFDQLDRCAGGSNYVTLASLRAALPDLSREVLDGAIHQLRRDRLASLDSADGRHDQLSTEESAAGIVEDGNRLVYMARKN